MAKHKNAGSIAMPPRPNAGADPIRGARSWQWLHVIRMNRRPLMSFRHPILAWNVSFCVAFSERATRA